MSASKFSPVAVAGSSFHSVAQARRIADRRLPRSVSVALLAGTESGRTLTDNVAAFDEVSFLPRLGVAPAERSQRTTVMGQDISLPVLIAPTGAQCIYPAGEVAAARAAAAAGTAMSLSSFATRPIEEVTAANPSTFAQIYWVGGREQVAPRVEQAREAGARGLIITLDWCFGYWQDWDTPEVPERINLATALKFAPEVLRSPRWLARYARHRALPDLVLPNVAAPGEAPESLPQVYQRWKATPSPTWEDVAWLRELWGGPLMVKGIGRVEDAKRAVEAGATAISVSNHGGNNLDGTPGAIRLLPTIAEAVGSQVEVLMDGGVRRGSDVVKALALGARAVLIGRAYLWGLAANGQAGVENVIELLRAGIDSTLLGLGRSSIAELSREDVVIGPSFFPEATQSSPALAGQQVGRGSRAENDAALVTGNRRP